MRKKLLWVSHFLLFPETGFGALQRSRNLLVEVAKEFDVTLICLITSQETNNFNPVLIQQAKNDLLKFCNQVFLIKRQSRPSGMKLLKLFLNPFIPYSTFIYSLPDLKLKIEELLKETDFNLIFSDTLGLTENTLKSINCPTILNHHNIESAMMLRRAQKEKGFRKRIIFYSEARRLKRYERKYCPQYTLNLVVSEQDKQILLKNVGTIKTEIIPNPVDTSYFNFRKKAVNSKIISFIGGLTWYPNLSAMKYFLEKIWPEILLKQPDTIFKIVGKHEGEIENDYQNVIFLNFVKDIRELLANTRVFVCPITDGGGTRLKILDAVASGVPVVTTTIGVEGLEFEHEKQLLIADQPKKFASEVKRLLEDDKLSLDLAENAKKLLDEKYSLNVVGKKLKQTLNSL